MRTEKRLWIYSGLSVPEGVALVRPAVKRLKSVREVLLVGDWHAQGLFPPMARLAADSRVDFHMDARVGSSLRDWAKKDWLKVHLKSFEPKIVFIAIDPSDELARQAVKSRVKRSRAEVFWLVPFGIGCKRSNRYLSAPSDDIGGFAAWAARAWSVVEKD